MIHAITVMNEVNDATINVVKGLTFNTADEFLAAKEYTNLIDAGMCESLHQITEEDAKIISGLNDNDTECYVLNLFGYTEVSKEDQTLQDELEYDMYCEEGYYKSDEFRPMTYDQYMSSGSASNVVYTPNDEDDLPF
tara:strand:+ start:905 stop:1315 length:411 start_codon:yes stop_codon:yes gene_type:complete